MIQGFLPWFWPDEKCTAYENQVSFSLPFHLGFLFLLSIHRQTDPLPPPHALTRPCAHAHTAHTQHTPGHFGSSHFGSSLRVLVIPVLSPRCVPALLCPEQDIKRLRWHPHGRICGLSGVRVKRGGLPRSATSGRCTIFSLATVLRQFNGRGLGRRKMMS